LRIVSSNAIDAAGAMGAMCEKARGPKWRKIK
jgi:hypothetical protein